MKGPGGKVVILGGGMAGLSAAWRLSQPGWRDRFDSITVYQRGWRLGGKGASSRGEHGRIQEHGLHIWLGSYENAFTLLRECYAELDRSVTDPHAPIRRWDQAVIPADNPGLADYWDGAWLTWLGTHPREHGLPGDPGNDGREVTVTSFVERALLLLHAFAQSSGDAGPAGLSLSTSPEPTRGRTDAAGALTRAVAVAALALADPAAPTDLGSARLDSALIAVREAIDYETRADHRRAWLLASLVTACIRGVLADNLVTNPTGFRAINDEEFGQWVLRHGGHPDVLDSAMVRGLYDLVFGYDAVDSERPHVAAGVMVFLVGQALFTYRGSFFWKMTAGMGDIVIAPLYQVLKRRGVRFEFFHRLDGLHLDRARQNVESITMGRQAWLVDGLEEYAPLVTVRGLPVFPDAPRAEQLRPHQNLRELESHFSVRDDAETRTLRRGVDFDHVVLAVSLGMVPMVAGELLADRSEWRAMTTQVRTVATQAFQLWLHPDEPTLGWPQPGSTVSAYLRPFETWASMPQTLWAETWPPGDEPRTVAYFCGSLCADWPTAEPPEDYVRRLRDTVLADAAEHVEQHLGLFFPNALTHNGFDWSLVAGAGNTRGVEAMATQHVSVNIDPSDRYVQSVPGSDRFRLRPDESGYDNLVLAGDWTDCGLNAGCIEAAVMSGLEAANAVLGRGRFHRLRGYWLP
ncbi:MAG: FAD-dependent oxidoreductase [Mycobacterium sp.]